MTKSNSQSLFRRAAAAWADQRRRERSAEIFRNLSDHELRDIGIDPATVGKSKVRRSILNGYFA